MWLGTFQAETLVMLVMASSHVAGEGDGADAGALMLHIYLRGLYMMENSKECVYMCVIMD